MTFHKYSGKEKFLKASPKYRHVIKKKNKQISKIKNKEEGIEMRQNYI